MSGSSVPQHPTLSLALALERFLSRPGFALRTRENYAQDLAPLLGAQGTAPLSALTAEVAGAFLARLEYLAPRTWNRRLAALRSFARWSTTQGWLSQDPTAGIERRKEPRRPPRALDPEQVEAVLRRIGDARDRAFFWLLYEGGLRCREALTINVEDIDWQERSIRIRGKGDAERACFFSRHVSRLLDAYLKTRENPTQGPLFITSRRARAPRRADLTPEGFARLSYRQADTLWKHYTPDWDLHQLRHTAISARAARGYTEVELKQFSGHTSLRSLEGYIASNREAARRKARDWERRTALE